MTGLLSDAPMSGSVRAQTLPRYLGPFRLFAFVLVALAMAASAASASGLTTSVQNAARFCLTYMETGQQSDILLRNGFRKTGNGFGIQHKRNLLIGHDNDVNVSLRKRNGKVLCDVSIGSGGIKRLNEFLRASAETAAAAGYRRADGDVLQKGATAVRLSGKRSSGFGSISSRLTFEPLK